MSRIDGWLHSIRTLARRGRADDDTRDELAFHLERQAAKHIGAGMAHRIPRQPCGPDVGAPGGVGRVRAREFPAAIELHLPQ